MTGLCSAHVTFAAATQVQDCTFATLQTDVQAGGDWYYAPGQCSSSIAVTSTITIGGAASLTSQGNDITLDGAKMTQLFSVNAEGAFALKGLTLQNGNATGSAGGAIFNQGTLTVANSTLSHNATSYSGGAIANSGGAVTVTNSTLSANSAAGSSGAILIDGGTLTLSNSTLAGNSATSDGGAIGNFVGTAGAGQVLVNAATIWGNSVSSGGGAIYNVGAVKIGGSIVANNTGGGNCSAPVTDAGYNLEDTSPSTCGFSSTNHDIVGQNPNLGPLQSNGGPTLTMALGFGSPAIDTMAASLGLCQSTDQRGVSRPDNGETSCDMGAYEAVAVKQTVNAPAGWSLIGGSPLSLWPDASVSWSWSAGTGTWSHPTGAEPAETGTWEELTSARTEQLTVQVCTAGVPISIPVVAHRWNMVGNPCSTAVSIPATAQALLWNSTTQHYQPTTSIPPGLGAWVKPSGSSLALTPS